MIGRRVCSPKHSQTKEHSGRTRGAKDIPRNIAFKGKPSFNRSHSRRRVEQEEEVER
jgi:hypothetical protein